MEPLKNNIRKLALDRFLERVADQKNKLRPDGPPLPYDTCLQLEQVVWRISIAAIMVGDELRELTNSLNAWKGALQRWDAWLDVLKQFDEEDAWSLQWEFVEPVAFQCMFQPAATRDRLVFVGTNALHQARLSVEKAYPDRLDADPEAVGKRARVLSRGKSESQLRRIAGHWVRGADFVASLSALDDKNYRQLTANFRNLASHAIAPRLQVGITNAVMRVVEQTTKSVPLSNGTYAMVKVPNSQSVAYIFGGTNPLDMSKLLELNIIQYEYAAVCFNAYVAVLNEAIAGMRPLKPKT